MINKIPKEKLFDFDESGIDLNINNEYGYIKKGVRLKIKRSGRRGSLIKSNVRRILNNHLYIGKVKHKDKLFDGVHKPIIDEQIWQKTRELISTNNKIQTPTSRVTTAPLLKGIMNCGICGSKMTPTYTTKQGKRYRYYICQSKHKGNNDLCKVGRISANETENLVTDQVLNFLKKPEFIIHTINAKKDDLSENKIINSFKTIDKIWDELFPVEQARIINLLIKQIDIKPEGLNIKIFKEGLHSLSTEIFE